MPDHGMAIVAVPNMTDGMLVEFMIWVQCECGFHVTFKDLVTRETLIEETRVEKHV